MWPNLRFRRLDGGSHCFEKIYCGRRDTSIRSPNLKPFYLQPLAIRLLRANNILLEPFCKRFPSP